MFDTVSDSVPSPNDALAVSEIKNMEELKYSFDPSFYCERYSDIDTRYVEPLEHYCVFGWKENRDPCAWFSTRLYLAHNPDVAKSNVNPFLHYVLYGRDEGRPAWRADHRGPFELEVDPTVSLVTDAALLDLVAFPPCPPCKLRSPVIARRLQIHWVIPDFTAGSGGHMTIFRLIRWLEIAGHECVVWIADPVHHKNAEAAYEDIVKHFQTIRARVAFAADGLQNASGDAIFATGWQTVARILNVPSFAERFYLVQDYEPSFHPMGSHALAAAWTYSQDLACICASPWLAQRLRDEHGRWTAHFWLAYDKAIYWPKPDGNKRLRPGQGQDSVDQLPRIALYARAGTARRAVELALLALQHLAAKGVRFHVDLFGEENLVARAPFPCTSHGILAAEDLAKLYRAADLGVCFSSTNYSLIPQEMMACGLPVVEIDGASTRAVFPDDVVAFAGPHPLAIAAEIEALLSDPERRRQQADAALRWTTQFDWEASAKAVEGAILDRLRLSGRAELIEVADVPLKPLKRRAVKRGGKTRRTVAEPEMKASVCIPTFNGGALLVDVLERVRSQRAPWPFEVIIVDSSSTDGSIERLDLSTALETGAPPVHVQLIAQTEFQHGRTRNLLATLARGEFVAFLTQDALPADEFWLYNLVSVFERYPDAAGAFGRHLPWPSSSPFVQRDITQHFDAMLANPLVVSRATKPVDAAGADCSGWRQVLHYYSDNNSCLRRSVWSMVPYPEIEYGEDQAWADKIIQLGYSKVYVPSASVYHSHDYTLTETTARAEIESRFFANTFGYQCYDHKITFQEQLAAMDNSDIRWARENGVSDADLARRLLENKAALFGRILGMERVQVAPLHRP